VSQSSRRPKKKKRDEADGGLRLVFCKKKKKKVGGRQVCRMMDGLGGTWMVCKREGCFTARCPNFEARLTDGLMKCERRCGTVGMLRHEYIVNDVLEMGRGQVSPIFCELTRVDMIVAG